MADDEENKDGGGDDWGDALKEQQDGESKEQPEKAELDNVSEEGNKEKEGNSDIENCPNIDVILEIPVVISMEVGKTDISIRNLLKLNQGSVVELDRFAGDPLDVYVNSTLVAHGEVVVVNEKFGIRLTDVISQAERIEKLGEVQ